MTLARFKCGPRLHLGLMAALMVALTVLPVGLLMMGQVHRFGTAHRCRSRRVGFGFRGSGLGGRVWDVANGGIRVLALAALLVLQVVVPIVSAHGFCERASARLLRTHLDALGKFLNSQPLALETVTTFAESPTNRE
ncbi:hypothetical protein BASA81_006518 [Batrachochytrium salamandrivorans]|nr:hypothetical protein BASA81_006518 [Batrachochytrium salamandrivorans]